MTIIYRIQDRDGRGPWKPGFSGRWVEHRDDHKLLQPWYIEFPDLKLEKGWRYGCGCETRKQLQRWITIGEYTTLRILSYRSVMIDACEIVASSDIQCVFRKREKLNVGATEFNLYLELNHA
ncbi:MAG: hypothetical protein E6Q97_32760 [Desulfurellales bacterium]|nr:MAG: hypothetical protein E6Q97_32760 [Desulfurellales bacterium]